MWQLEEFTEQICFRLWAQAVFIFVNVGYLKSFLQARQSVFLSNVYIWKLCWLAVALSGFMLDLNEDKFVSLVI